MNRELKVEHFFSSSDLQKALRTYLENKLDNVLFESSFRPSLSESKKYFQSLVLKQCQDADMVSVFQKFPAPQTSKLHPPH